MKALRDLAAEYEELYRTLYSYLHVRRSKRVRALTPQAWGVLQHLTRTGPLTVTEAARHMDRAQSVMSEIIDALEARGLLSRVRDARDRRRTLVWLTDEGHALLAEAERVLSHDRLADALARMSPAERKDLFHGMRALVRACASWNEKATNDDTKPKKKRSSR